MSVQAPHHHHHHVCIRHVLKLVNIAYRSYIIILVLRDAAWCCVVLCDAEY